MKTRNLPLWAITFIAFFAMVLTASSASAAYSRFIPSGIDGSNPNVAWQQVSSRADVDASYARMISREAGVSSFNSAEYRPVGYTSAVIPGTSNSAVSPSGSAVPVADHGNSATVKKLIVIHIRTGKKVYIMVRCANPRVRTSRPLPWKPFKTGTLVKFKKTVTKSATITCPSGQSVTGTVKVTVTGTASGKTWGKVQGNMNAQTEVKVDAKVKAELTLQCGPPPVTPPVVVTPPATVVCTAPTPVWNGTTCVAQTNTTTTTQTAEQQCKATVSATWNGSMCVIIQNTTVININAVCSKVVINYSDGTISTTFKDANGNTVTESFCSTTVVNPPPPPPPVDVCPNIEGNQSTIPTGMIKDANGNCVTPPPPVKSINIVSHTTLNDIPNGKSSGPFQITVNASDAGGSLTVDPGIGAVSKCDSTTPLGSVTFSSLPAGNSESCIILYAPNDPLKPSTMTVVMNASLANVFSTKPHTFAIQYPTPPV